MQVVDIQMQRDENIIGLNGAYRRYNYLEKIAVSSKSAIALYGPVGLAQDLSELEKSRVA